MTFYRTLTMTSALALFAGPALADLTADQVLADQLQQMSMYGLTAEVSGESRSGDTLTVDSLTATGELPEGAFSMTIGGAQFTEQGDGTVLMTYPNTIPLSIAGISPEGETFKVEMTITQTGTQSVVSGSPEKIRYDFSSDQFTLANFRISEPAEAAELDMNVTVTASAIAGFMELAGGTVRDYSADFSIGTASIIADMTAPDGDEGNFQLNITSNDIASTYTGSAAPQSLGDSLAVSIKNGNTADGTMSYGATTYSIAADTPDGSFEGAAAIGSGEIDFKMDESGLDYGGTNRDITASFGGSAIPFPPMSFKLAEHSGRFAIPVIPGDDIQNFALRIAMLGLEVDPMLWGMFDPAEQLPRDPANLVVDIDGDMILSQDIFAPEFAEQPMMAPPGQVNDVNINEIRLSFGGAELTGDGDITLDNSMGMPMPYGVVNVMLKGGNTLMDTLVGMGLLPEDQAMGARMMMGLFARPGEGPDTLVSTIEMKQDGSILANGQRIK